MDPWIHRSSKSGNGCLRSIDRDAAQWSNHKSHIWPKLHGATQFTSYDDLSGVKVSTVTPWRQECSVRYKNYPVGPKVAISTDFKAPLSSITNWMRCWFVRQSQMTMIKAMRHSLSCKELRHSISSLQQTSPDGAGKRAGCEVLSHFLT